MSTKYSIDLMGFWKMGRGFDFRGPKSFFVILFRELWKVSFYCDVSITKIYEFKKVYIWFNGITRKGWRFDFRGPKFMNPKKIKK